MEALKECKYNDNALKLAIDKDVLEKRTLEEQIKLMEALKECEYNGNALKVAAFENVLEKRTAEEQIKLMEALKECEYNGNALKMVINNNVLETKTTEEQIKLMKSQNSVENKDELMHSENLIKINNLKELRKYIDSLKEEYGGKTDIKIKDVVKLYK